LDCLGDSVADYYESLENNPKHAVTAEIADRYDPEDYGYSVVQDDFVSGFHPGQNDNPQRILANARTPHIDSEESGRFLFVLTYSSQFEMGFSLYKKNEE
jgi:hypothetical protein